MEMYKNITESFMKKKDVSAERVCAFCEKSTAAPSGDKGEELVLCSKRGLVKASGYCHSFKYDLLKREPKMQPELPKIEKIDI